MEQNIDRQGNQIKGNYSMLNERGYRAMLWDKYNTEQFNAYVRSVDFITTLDAKCPGLKRVYDRSGGDMDVVTAYWKEWFKDEEHDELLVWLDKHMSVVTHIANEKFHTHFVHFPIVEMSL